MDCIRPNHLGPFPLASLKRSAGDDTLFMNFLRYFAGCARFAVQPTHLRMASHGQLRRVRLF
jgi:hypothetical protein